MELITSWSLPVVIHRYYEFEWIVKDENLRRMKECKIGQHFYSENFNGNAVCLYCSPKGWIEENENTFSFQVKLLRLPIDVRQVLVELLMESDFMDHSVKDERRLEYDQCRSGWPSDVRYRYDSKLFEDVKEIKMKCVMRILKVYGDEDVIEKDLWKDYGIIN